MHTNQEYNSTIMWVRIENELDKHTIYMKMPYHKLCVLLATIICMAIVIYNQFLES